MFQMIYRHNLKQGHILKEFYIVLILLHQIHCKSKKGYPLREIKNNPLVRYHNYHSSLLNMYILQILNIFPYN